MEQREDANLKTQEIEKSIRKNFINSFFPGLPKQFGIIGSCRRGIGLPSVFPVEKIRC